MCIRTFFYGIGVRMKCVGQFSVLLWQLTNMKLLCRISKRLLLHYRPENLQHVFRQALAKRTPAAGYTCFCDKVQYLSQKREGKNIAMLTF